MSHDRAKDGLQYFVVLLLFVVCVEIGWRLVGTMSESNLLPSKDAVAAFGMKGYAALETAKPKKQTHGQKH
jgi:hypothetical protein